MKRSSAGLAAFLLAIAMSAPAAHAQESDKVKAGTESDVNAIGNRKVGHGWDMYSIQREIALGKQLSEEVEKTSKLLHDPVVVGYVNKVGQNLVRNSDAQVPFTIKVIDDDHINAFALPGGFFYVNTGVILHADNEAELAGVMAHEIAHVAARHQTRNETKANIMQIASIPLIMALPGTMAGYGAYEGLNLAIPMTYLKFSRDAEREADYLGIQYMYKAGYDPNMFVEFFEKIEAEEKKQPGTIPKIFDTHPPTPDRIIAAQNEIATILPPRPEYIVDTSEFDMVKQRLIRLQSGEKLQEARDGGAPTLETKAEREKRAKAQGQQQGQQGNDNAPVLKRRP
ncbi:MAG TPA: M48 family metallopeptidase [Candidatus Limnocylindrales bacterium]|nr:M48 family metallopeptidase [Candidatus Limnocylindrales bacterium]